MIFTPFGQRLKNYFKSKKLYDCTVSVNHRNQELINVTVKNIKAISKTVAEDVAKKAVIENLNITVTSIKSNGSLKPFKNG